jgi:TM2 domain-containing membrane protein YozV
LVFLGLILLAAVLRGSLAFGLKTGLIIGISFIVVGLLVLLSLPNEVFQRYEAFSDAHTDGGLGILTDGSKRYAVTWVLAVFFGNLGADRFYLGKVKSGVLKLLTLGGLGIWALADIITLEAGKTRDSQGRLLVGADRNTRIISAFAYGALIVVAVIVFASR